MRFVSIVCILLLAPVYIFSQGINRRYIFDRTSVRFNTIIPFNDNKIGIIGSSTESTIPYHNKLGSSFIDSNKFDIPWKSFTNDANKSYVLLGVGKSSICCKDVIVTGYSGEDPAFAEFGLVARFDSALNLKWIKEYPRSDSSVELFICKSSVLLQNHLYVLGYEMLGGKNNKDYKSNILIIKLDTNGSEIWRKNYFDDNQLDEYSEHLEEVDSNHFVLAACVGKFNNPRDKPEVRYTQIHYLKIDTGGNIIAQSFNPDSNIYAPHGFIYAKSRDYYVSAAYIDSCIYNPNIQEGYFTAVGYLAKLDSNFHTQWELKLGVPSAYTFFKNIIPLHDDNYLAIGKTFDSLSGSGTYTQSGWMVKFSPEGKVIWDRRYYGVESNYDENELYDAQELPNGDILACGQSTDNTVNYPQQGWLLRTDSYGCLVPGCQNVGIKAREKETIQIHLYPNPANEVLYLSIGLPETDSKYSFNIVDVQGREIASQSRVWEGEYRLPLNNWAKGLYLLNVYRNGVLMNTQKFIKQ